MSQFFDVNRSAYLQETTKTLKRLREANNSPNDELFACSPHDNQALKDERTLEELVETIDVDKLKTQLKNFVEGTEVWIGICCGGFAPIHNSHIQMGKEAINYLHNQGKNVAMVYFVPGNTSYTEMKLTKRGDTVPEYLKGKHIEGCLKATFSDEPQLDGCTLDLGRLSYCEWYVSASELTNLLRYLFPNFNLQFVVIGGEDLVRSPSQLFKGSKVVDFANLIMMLPRDMDNAKRNKYPLASDVIVLPQCDASLSSTKVRALLKDKRFDELEKNLHPNTLKYLKAL